MTAFMFVSKGSTHICSGTLAIYLYICADFSPCIFEYIHNCGRQRRRQPEIATDFGIRFVSIGCQKCSHILSILSKKGNVAYSDGLIQLTCS